MNSTIYHSSASIPKLDRMSSLPVCVNFGRKKSEAASVAVISTFKRRCAEQPSQSQQTSQAQALSQDQFNSTFSTIKNHLPTIDDEVEGLAGKSDLDLLGLR